MTTKTRVKQSIFSEIVKLSDRDMTVIRSGRGKKGSGACEMVRKLGRKSGFFIVSEQTKGWSHLYKTAQELGFTVEVLRGSNDEGDLGYWVIRD